MSVDLGRSDIWIFPKCIPAFTQSIRICKQKEMLDFICFLKLSCFLVYLVDTLVVGKSLPLAASPLFCTTCGSQSKHAVCTYHIWHVLSLERPDWSIRKCCGLVFWATDSFLFPRPPNTPLIPLLGLLLHPTQTDTCFLSFLIPLPLLGGIFPSIQLYKHWNWLSTAELQFLL